MPLAPTVLLRTGRGRAIESAAVVPNPWVEVVRDLPTERASLQELSNLSKAG